MPVREREREGGSNYWVSGWVIAYLSITHHPKPATCIRPVRSTRGIKVTIHLEDLESGAQSVQPGKKDVGDVGFP